MKNLFNFKSLCLFLIVIISTLSFKTAHATHLLGADIATECLGTNLYRVTLSIYRDCNGNVLANTQDIRLRAACSGTDITVAATKLSVTDITQPCPGGQSSCNGGTGAVGVEKHIYQTIVNVPAAAVCDLRFSWRLLARSVALTTIVNPNNTSVYTETIVDNTVASCNNSPEFTLDPISFFPVNQPASLNYLVADADGDSLVYSMVDALSNTTTNVNYTPGVSGVLPLGPGVPITIDQNTGTITFTPNAIAVTVFAIKIEEFRNGVLIGSVIRDMNVTILATTNSSPIISGLDNNTNTDTVLCPGQFFTSQILLTGTSNLFIFGDISNNIPGLSISQNIVNTDTTILTLNWFPTAANIGNNIFYVTAKGDQCPVRLISSKGFNLRVGPNPPVVSTSILNSATCATSNDGSAFHISTGLLPGYSATWFDVNDNLVGTSDTLTGVGTGFYSVRITNGPGFCTIIDNVFIPHNNSTTSTAAFNISAAAGCSVPHAVTFTDQSTVNDIACGTVWAWTFGDGATSTLQNPSHTYTAVGNYPVSLTITDCSVSCPTTVWDTVKVSTPTVDFNGSNLAGCAPLTSNFTSMGVSPAGITNWNWIFGDGNTSTLQNPSNIYTTPGNYTVSLSVTDANGCIAGPEVKTNFVAVSLALTSTDVQVACDALTWIDGNTYTTSNNTATITLTAANGCDSIVTLDLTINNSSGSIDTQVACDSFTWSDGMTYTASTSTATQTFTNAVGCDSTLTLNLTINNSSTSTDTQVACDSFTWIDGNTYTSSNNTATQTFTNAAGCDSVVTLDLTINNSAATTDTQVACDSFTWIDGNTYAVSNNTATVTLTTSAGCDSVVTLALTINNSNSSTDTYIECDSFTWIDGNTYTTNNTTATVTLTNAAGCDSLVTLNLTINSSSTSTDTQVACDSFTWIDGVTYTANNTTATVTLTNAAGCDSVITLDLTINNSSTSIDTHVACDNFTWIDGNTYTVSNNTATQTFTNAVGCDSVVTLDLTINNSTATTDTQIACNTFTWIDGNTYTVSNNTATVTLTTSAGCDSIVTLDLTINNSSTFTDVQVACDTLIWIDGNTYTASNNTAMFTMLNTTGCDSVITLDLTINNSSTSIDTQVACDSLTWIDGNTYIASNNTATFTMPNAAGCDSIITLDLTINNNSTFTDVQVACDSLMWIDGNTYSVSNNTATFTMPNAAGCDSIITLDLTINNSSAATDVHATCIPFTWIDGNTYAVSNNTATVTLTNAVGCDSVVTLDLTVDVVINTTDAVVACDSLTWIDGTTYFTSIVGPMDTLIAAAGCDSIVTLDLTITTAVSGIDTIIACDTITWIDGNVYGTSNNTATFTLVSAAGCDSVVTLDLSINANLNTTDIRVACDSLTWTNGVTYFTNIVGPMDTLIAAAGCDSIVTLDLSINANINTTDVVVACDSLTWIDGVTYFASIVGPMDTLIAAAGCDSIITLDLTIGTLDNTVTQTNDTLLANQAGATYQWIDCGNGDTILPGDTTQMYIATVSGDYAVIVSTGTCSDTSDCINVLGTGIESVDRDKEFTVYPNPTTGNSFVKFTQQQEVYLVITDLTGKVLFETRESSTDKLELPVAEFVKGIYLVKIQSNNQQQVIKLVKQ